MPYGRMPYGRMSYGRMPYGRISYGRMPYEKCHMEKCQLGKCLTVTAIWTHVIIVLVIWGSYVQGCQIFLGTKYQNGKKYTK
jgi:hypothetical protein